MNKLDKVQAAKELKETKKAAIFTHESPDGDAIGSALGLSASIDANGGQSVVFAPDQPPSNYDFLRGFDEIYMASDEAIKDLVAKGFRIIVVDGSSPNRCGLQAFPEGSKPLVIDHHPTVEDYGQMIYFDASASSTAELLYGLLDEAKMPIDTSVGDAFFAGILTDTGSFRFPNVTVNTMEVVAKLIKADVSTSNVAMMIYERMTLANRKLLGRAMDRLSSAFDGRLALTAITWNDMTEFSAEMKDADFIVDEIRKLKGAEIYVFAKEYRPDQFRISMRGRGKIDLAQLAQKYGGGGHHDAAGFNTTGDWLFVRANLLQIFEAVFKG